MLQDTGPWPLVAPLPSYGRGRERPGGRYVSFIHGDGLHDVILTGQYSEIISWKECVCVCAILVTL